MSLLKKEKDVCGENFQVLQIQYLESFQGEAAPHKCK